MGAARNVVGSADGIKAHIKKLILRRPGISIEDIEESLDRQFGQAPSRLTISGIRSDFRHSLRLLKRLKYIDIDI